MSAPDSPPYLLRQRRRPWWKTTLIHGGLFLLAVFTTMLAGAELSSGKYWLNMDGMIPEDRILQFREILLGLPYALCFLAFLSFHEFGHYFTARYHRVKASLPYYIPLFFPIPGVLNIGSLGAVIRLRQVPPSTRKYFDIGIAGPLAGFVVSLFLLGYGFATLPDMQSYVSEREPDYATFFGEVPTEEALTAYIEAEANDGDDVQVMAYKVGTSLVFEAFKAWIPEDPAQVPSHYDLLHYPLLFVGYITLFFTALNLLPMGQLDGGHIIYGMFGRATGGRIARATLIVLIFIGGTGLVGFRELEAMDFLGIGLYLLFLLYLFSYVFGRDRWKEITIAALLIFMMQALIKWNFPDLQPNLIWLVYSWLVTRFVGLDHPPATVEHRVDRPRQILGWVAIVIFILCFSPAPLQVVGG